MKIIQSKELIQTAADTSDSSHISLQLLGLSQSVSERPPSVTSCPPSFSNEANALWVKLWKKERFVDAVKHSTDIPTQWKTALRMLLDYCKESGVAPFSSLRNRVDNATLTSFLLSARLKLKSFVDSTKLLHDFKVIRGTQDRKYVTGFAQFSVRSSIRVKSPYKTSAELFSHINNLGFVREPNSTFKKIIAPHVVLFVQSITTSKVTVWYEIDGCSGVYMGTKNQLPTKKQVSQFCDATLYLPIIRTHRFAALGNHTLF